MITFRPMTSLAASFVRVLPVVWSLALAAQAQSPLSPQAPSPLSHLDDAAPVPSGMLRLRLANVWTRYDERFAPSGTTSLGVELSADSLGSAQLPRLLPIEAGLRTLAVDPALRLSLGFLHVG